MKKRLIFKKVDTGKKKADLRLFRLISIQHMRFYWNRLQDGYLPFPVEKK